MQRVFLKFNVQQTVTSQNYNNIRKYIMNHYIQEKPQIDYDESIFVHFTYCSDMKSFPKRFHTLWQKYFNESPIAEIIPILGTRNVNNLQRQLVRKK
jgi:hypothetical protein